MPEETEPTPDTTAAEDAQAAPETPDAAQDTPKAVRGRTAPPVAAQPDEDPMVTVAYKGPHGALIDGDVTFPRDQPVTVARSVVERLRALLPEHVLAAVD